MDPPYLIPWLHLGFCRLKPGAPAIGFHGSSPARPSIPVVFLHALIIEDVVVFAVDFSHQAALFHRRQFPIRLVGEEGGSESDGKPLDRVGAGPDHRIVSNGSTIEHAHQHDKEEGQESQQHRGQIGLGVGGGFLWPMLMLVSAGVVSGLMHRTEATLKEKSEHIFG